MPHEPPPPQSGTTPLHLRAMAASAPTERFALHAWALIILLALLWVLLS